MIELQSTWEQIPSLLVKFCDDTNIQLRLQAFESVSSIVQLFNSQQRHNLYEVLSKNILNDDNLVARYLMQSTTKIMLNSLTNFRYAKRYLFVVCLCRTECAKCIRTIAEVYPDEISNHLNARLKSIEKST